MSEQSHKKARNPSPAELAGQVGQQLWGERPSLDEVARLARQAPDARNSSGAKAEDAAEALGRIAGPETRAAPDAGVPQEEVAPVRLNRRRRQGWWLWPSVRTLQSAHEATRRAFWWSVVFAFMTGLMSFLALWDVPSVLAIGIGPESLITAALLAGIAVGLYRHSRFAAVAGLALIIAEIIARFSDIAWPETGSASSNYAAKLFVPIICMFVLIGAVRGTFAYHRMRQAYDQKNMA
ncbi:MAG: hypothetical protein NTU94_08885 [Planctomycetota bacterium]|nr:hypothetical protein [Planctomycetota bacterium]